MPFNKPNQRLGPAAVRCATLDDNKDATSDCTGGRDGIVGLVTSAGLAPSMGLRSICLASIDERYATP